MNLNIPSVLDSSIDHEEIGEAPSGSPGFFMRSDSIFIDSDSIPSIWTVFHRKRTVFERNSIVSPFTGKNTQKKALN